MSRVIVIGGSGHVGTYLLPALVERGHDVINVSRGQAKRYRPHAAWNAIEQVVVDRTVQENAGTFGSTVAALRPDVVVDMISFRLSSTQSLVAALRGKTALATNLPSMRRFNPAAISALLMPRWVSLRSDFEPHDRGPPRRDLRPLARRAHGGPAQAAVRDRARGEGRGELTCALACCGA